LIGRYSEGINFCILGLFQQQSRANVNSLLPRGSVSIQSVNGQQVPSYATADLVQNAMNRLWRSDGKLEVVVCDDARELIIDSMSKKKLM
jgi:hypothetical protein